MDNEVAAFVAAANAVGGEAAVAGQNAMAAFTAVADLVDKASVCSKPRCCSSVGPALFDPSPAGQLLSGTWLSLLPAAPSSPCAASFHPTPLFLYLPYSGTAPPVSVEPPSHTDGLIAQQPEGLITQQLAFLQPDPSHGLLVAVNTSNSI